ncbi:integral membrane protein [Colletotrichum falcatum]|nr:integral membrane protein [Colletotrichum falcatum]
MANPPKGSEAWKAQDRGPAIIAVCWVFTALSTMFVMSRVYVRLRFAGRFYSDDYFIILGLMCGYISTSLSTLAVASGTGRHLDVLTLEQQQANMLWTTAAQCPGIMSFSLPKLAVICLLTRLLNPGTLHKWFLWWMGVWCQLTLVATVGLLIGRCTPARSLWDFSVPGTCFDPAVLVDYSIYAGTFSAFVDVYLAVYPAIVLFKLQMRLKKKLALSCALGIGSISGAVAIYKTTRLPLLANEDYSYETPDLVVWTVVEGSTIIIASSIPVLHPLLEIILRRNPFASTGEGTRRTARSYGNPPSSSSKPCPSPGRHTYELGQRRSKPKLKDHLGFTITEDGSQEDMLYPSHASYTQTVTASTISEPGQVHLGRIVRTDSVTVVYDGER